MNVKSWLTRKTIEPKPSIPPKPTISFIAFQTLDGTLTKLIPLPNKLTNVLSHIRFKLQHALLREDMGDDLALPSMVGPDTGVEETAFDRDESIVEI